MESPVREKVLNDLARLLASENIEIHHTRSLTEAFFDVKKRELHLPEFNLVDETRYLMYLVHEVSHALYTPSEEWHKEAAKSRRFKTALNMVEDARVERLIKRKYPGVRRDLSAGYKRLHELDSFGIASFVESKSLSKLSLVDRMNLYAKLRGYVTVPFSRDETQFVDRLDSVLEWSDAVTLAKDVLEFSDARAAKRREIALDFSQSQRGDKASQTESPSSDSEGDETEETSDSQTGETDVGQADSESLSDQEFGEMLEDFTQRSIDSRMQKDLSYRSSYACPKIRIDYRSFDYRHYVTPLKRHIEYLLSNCDDEAYGAYKNRSLSNPGQHNPPPPAYTREYVFSKEQAADLMREFNTKNRSTISYLLKEYEAKKAADEYMRAREDKTGTINPTALHRYKISEDVFRRSTVVQSGKSHGIVMFVDFSGSMSSVLKDTIEQVVLLVSFCRRAGIKHRVFSFTQRNKGDAVDFLNGVKDRLRTTKQLMGEEFKSVEFIDEHTDLLEMFRDDMSQSEYAAVAGNLMRGNRSPVYSLGYTPLNSTIVLARQVVRDFKTQSGVQQVSVAFLTDGYSDKSTYATYIDSETRQPIAPGGAPVQFSAQTAALVQSLRAALGVTVVNFHIIYDVGSRSLRYLTQEQKRRLKRDGSISIPGAEGYDSQYMILRSNMKAGTDIGEQIADKTITDRELTRRFIAANTKRLSSRVILEDFVKRVSRPAKESVDIKSAA